MHGSAGCTSGRLLRSDGERGGSQEVFLLLAIAGGVEHFRLG